MQNHDPSPARDRQRQCTGSIVDAKASGGGITGQAGALRLAISRAILEERRKRSGIAPRRGSSYARSENERAKEVRSARRSQAVSIFETLIHGVLHGAAALPGFPLDFHRGQHYGLRSAAMPGSRRFWLCAANTRLAARVCPRISSSDCQQRYFGNTIWDLQRRWESDVIDEQPQLVSIKIGINDVWHGLTGAGGGTPIARFS